MVITETLQLSGILTILFSAITARRYINHNIPPEAQRASAFVFELIAYLAETSVFLYLGFDVFSSVHAVVCRCGGVFTNPYIERDWGLSPVAHIVDYRAMYHLSRNGGVSNPHHGKDAVRSV